MLAIVQAIAAWVAAATQLSLQDAILKTYGRGPAIVAAVSIVLVGLLTLGADVQAGCEGLTLLSGIPFYYFVAPVVALVGWMLVTKSYLKIERFLAWLTLVFLCYVASAIYARPDWGAVLHAIAVPRLTMTPLLLGGAVALLGTTLTGYVYFWESIEVAERRLQGTQVRAAAGDAVVGMLVAGSSFFFILIATAATLGKNHAPIQTAAQAAAALQPLAGALDKEIFAVGLLASAAIAIPVVAATNGYVVAQTCGAVAGLTLPPKRAQVFYGTVLASLVLGGALAMLPLPTIALLYWVSVISGLATPVTLALTMLVAQNRVAMRGRPIGRGLACAGWTVTTMVSLSCVAFIASLFTG
jgi:Mn2+/Fe2+ NRAMP family transporter